MIAGENKILSLIKEHKSGNPIGLTSICSANEFVIKAAMLNAKKHDNLLLIESTSNQVDQFGGYTGMTPQIFKELAFRLADQTNFSITNLYLGGDHLGPNVWHDEPANSALEKAKEQVKAYLNAGYKKIHLDVTMKCADDDQTDSPLDSSIIAERTALLCKAAEEVVNSRSNQFQLPVYIIGSDVPTPGGAKEQNNSMRVTTPEEVNETLSQTKKAFADYGIAETWSRVIAIVVQPGVEFGDDNIFSYDRRNTVELKNQIEAHENFVYEAHSTDFQLKESLREMVEDHFTILKVGPWLTYEFREALFALEMIEKELFEISDRIELSNLSGVLDSKMRENPKYWNKYYHGKDDSLIKFKRKYSLSDRIRYYWNDRNVKSSVIKLLQNLSLEEIPLTLISQFLPESFEAVKSGEIKNLPEELIANRISTVLDKYNYATSGVNS